MNKISEIAPEEKLALKIIKKYSLEPPIDLNSLVDIFAKLEEDLIPGNVDGVCLNKHPCPLIIIEKKLPPTRKRFTLAHELAHVIIPWHTGVAISCQVMNNDPYLDILYNNMEVEANKFAAELLMPRSWLIDLSKENGIEPLIHKVASQAKVSMQAACISIAHILEPGYVIVIEHNNQVLTSLKSPGTLVKTPERFKELNARVYNEFCTGNGTIEAHSTNIHWWYFNSEMRFGCTNDEREWRDVLSSILSEYYSDDEQRKKITRSISGIIGAINSSHKPETIEEFYGMFMQRILGRRDIVQIKEHKDFEFFLHKRFQDILSRR